MSFSEGESSYSDCELDEDLVRDVESLREVLEARETAVVEPTRSENTTLEQLQLCLKKNLELQGNLQQCLYKVNNALDQNERKRKNLRKSGKDCFKRIHTITKLRRAKSYFSDFRKIPDFPEIGCDFKLPDSLKNYMFEDNIWRADKEDEILKKHVLVQAIEIASKPLEGLLLKTNNEDEIKIIKEQMRDLSEVESAKNLLTDVETDEIDWRAVAYEAFAYNKSPDDCRLRWCNILSPATNNQSQWTKEEDVKLLKHGKESQGRNWAELAEKMNTNRSAFSCFKRYQSMFSNHKESRSYVPWTKELTEKLVECVKKHGNDNWELVSKAVGRSECQCRARWKAFADPIIRKGRWNVEEDNLLTKAVNEYGCRNWSVVASSVPHRTPVQCRERWVNCLDPTLNTGPWTPEEDKNLIELCKEYEGTVIPWSKIALSVPNRTDAKCAIRWRFLSSNERVVKYYQTLKMREAVKTKKSTLDYMDLDEDMLPDHVNKEVTAISKRVIKKRKAKETGSLLKKSDESTSKSSASTHTTPSVNTTPSTHTPPSLDIGDMLTTEELKKLGAIPMYPVSEKVISNKPTVQSKIPVRRKRLKKKIPRPRKFQGTEGLNENCKKLADLTPLTGRALRRRRPISSLLPIGMLSQPPPLIKHVAGYSSGGGDALSTYTTFPPRSYIQPPPSLLSPAVPSFNYTAAPPSLSSTTQSQSSSAISHQSPACDLGKVGFVTNRRFSFQEVQGLINHGVPVITAGSESDIASAIRKINPLSVWPQLRTNTASATSQSPHVLCSTYDTTSNASFHHGGGRCRGAKEIGPYRRRVRRVIVDTDTCNSTSSESENCSWDSKSESSNFNSTLDSIVSSSGGELQNPGSLTTSASELDTSPVILRTLASDHPISVAVGALLELNQKSGKQASVTASTTSKPVMTSKRIRSKRSLSFSSSSLRKDSPVVRSSVRIMEDPIASLDSLFSKFDSIVSSKAQSNKSSSPKHSHPPPPSVDACPQQRALHDGNSPINISLSSLEGDMSSEADEGGNNQCVRTTKDDGLAAPKDSSMEDSSMDEDVIVVDDDKEVTRSIFPPGNSVVVTYCTAPQASVPDAPQGTSTCVTPGPAQGTCTTAPGPAASPQGTGITAPSLAASPQGTGTMAPGPSTLAQGTGTCPTMASGPATPPQGTNTYATMAPGPATPPLSTGTCETMAPGPATPSQNTGTCTTKAPSPVTLPQGIDTCTTKAPSPATQPQATDACTTKAPSPATPPQGTDACTTTAPASATPPQSTATMAADPQNTTITTSPSTNMTMAQVPPESPVSDTTPTRRASSRPSTRISTASSLNQKTFGRRCKSRDMDTKHSPGEDTEKAHSCASNDVSTPSKLDTIKLDTSTPSRATRCSNRVQIGTKRPLNSPTKSPMKSRQKSSDDENSKPSKRLKKRT